jgi:hypothetical protein
MDWTMAWNMCWHVLWSSGDWYGLSTFLINRFNDLLEVISLMTKKGDSQD